MNAKTPRSDPSELRIVAQPLRRLVEQGLRDAIVKGRFAPGEHLSDRVLCDLFGASRPLIREAVRLLEAEGLIAVAPNRGPFVAFLSAAEAAQIYEVRAALEALAGEGFALHASEEERAKLEEIYEELVAVRLPKDRERVLDIKQRFYDVLTRGSRNKYIAKMLDQLFNRITQLRATSLSEPGRLDQTIRELRVALDAIEQRDPQAASDACRAHVKAAAAVAVRLLRELERNRCGATGENQSVKSA